MIRHALIDNLRLQVLNHEPYLDDSERKILAAREYRSQLRSEQYIYGRLLLKLLLSDYLGVDVRSLSIRSASSGLPELYIRDAHVSYISVSLSHDRDQLFVAVGVRCGCAVDIQLLHGIHWPSVIRAMGWSHHLNTWTSMDRDPAFYPALSLSARCGLLWTGFEAWMKLTECRFSPSTFAWTHIKLVSYEPASSSFIYKLNLAPRCPYYDAHILLMFRHNVCYAVSTI